MRYKFYAIKKEFQNDVVISVLKVTKNDKEFNELTNCFESEIEVERGDFKTVMKLANDKKKLLEVVTQLKIKNPCDEYCWLESFIKNFNKEYIKICCVVL